MSVALNAYNEMENEMELMLFALADEIALADISGALCQIALHLTLPLVWIPGKLFALLLKFETGLMKQLLAIKCLEWRLDEN